MTTVAPTKAIVSGVPTIRWDDIVTGDTVTAFALTSQCGLAGSVQIGGTFGGATVTLQGSNDGTTFFGLKDDNGTAISSTSAGYWEFSTAAVYVKPVVTGGAANAVDIILVSRG